MIDYAQHQQSASKRGLAWGLSVALALHLLAFYAIQSGLAHRFVKSIQTPVEAQLIEEVKPNIPPPPPPPPPPPRPPEKLQPQKSALPDYVPAVEVPQNAAPLANAITQFSSTPKPPAPPDLPVSVQAPPPMVRTSAVINASHSCETPLYPSVSKRMQESGTVQLRFHVGVDGKVLESEVEKSSGYKRLDEAARSALSKCQFKPATVDGRPEASWSSLRYVWKIEE